jgi:hypothetical protein
MSVANSAMSARATVAMTELLVKTVVVAHHMVVMTVRHVLAIVTHARLTATAMTAVLVAETAQHTAVQVQLPVAATLAK